MCGGLAQSLGTLHGGAEPGAVPRRGGERTLRPVVLQDPPNRGPGGRGAACARRRPPGLRPRLCGTSSRVCPAPAGSEPSDEGLGAHAHAEDHSQSPPVTVTSRLRVISAVPELHTHHVRGLGLHLSDDRAARRFGCAPDVTFERCGFVTNRRSLRLGAGESRTGRGPGLVSSGRVSRCPSCLWRGRVACLEPCGCELVGPGAPALPLVLESAMSPTRHSPLPFFFPAVGCYGTRRPARPRRPQRGPSATSPSCFLRRGPADGLRPSATLPRNQPPWRTHTCCVRRNVPRRPQGSWCRPQPPAAAAGYTVGLRTPARESPLSFPRVHSQVIITRRGIHGELNVRIQYSLIFFCAQ